ncbi:MAG: hypothetical protein AAFV43_14565 [Planctomycetota bacterium]
MMPDLTNRSSQARGAFCVPRVGVVLIGLSTSIGVATATPAFWDEPSLDTWVYPNSETAGPRPFTPTFGSLVVDPSTQEFFPSDASRLGTMVVAFETLDQATPGLSPTRYAIHSVTVTARVRTGQGGGLRYTNERLTPAAALAGELAGGLGTRVPMELFGIGFTGGYEGFALGTNPTGQRFSESDEPWQLLGDPPEPNYVVFPTVSDGNGGYADATNNLTGGFSVTEVSGETDAFDAPAWAVGTLEGVSEGDFMPLNSTYAFNFDLHQPGVIEYLQTGLADGVLGFTISSMHGGPQPGQGGGEPYPQWYAKEAAGDFPSFEAATLTIDFEILASPGDYDADGVVDTLDYDRWVADFGQPVSPVGTGADGNGDGIVGLADYTVWRDNAAITPNAIAAIGVPEPTTGGYVVAVVLTTAFCVGLGLCPSSRGPRR